MTQETTQQSVRGPESVRGPGQILKEDFLAPRGITPMAFASRLDFSKRELEQLLVGDMRIDRELACRIASILGTTPEYWLQLQQTADAELARRKGVEPPSFFYDMTGSPVPLRR